MPEARREGSVVLLLHAELGLAVQMRGDEHGEVWGLFGGWMEPGESPLACALREMVEEMELSLPADHLEFAGSFDFEFRGRSGRAHIFRCCVTSTLSEAVLHEGPAWRWATREECLLLNMLPHHRAILDQYWT